MASMTFEIWRGSAAGGEMKAYTIETDEGMVVLDAVHRIQAEHANDLSVRWNCKAGKCGSCSAEVNGMPRLMCMTRTEFRALVDLPGIEDARVWEPEPATVYFWSHNAGPTTTEKAA